MPLNIFAGAAALLSYCRTCASMVALNFLSWLSVVQVRSIMSSRALVMCSFTRRALVAVLQLISLLRGYVEYKSKHGDVCSRQILGLNQFPGEKSLRCPDVMCTRLQMQTVKI